MPQTFVDPDDCVEEIVRRVGRRLVVGVPLGLGKPNQLVNALYRRARDQRDIELRLLTALSLERPRGHGELERRFLAPFVERHFGPDYPDLDYLADLRTGSVPDNVELAEFYLAPGQFLGVETVQQNYTSVNYTHVGREMLRRGVNVVTQLVSRGRSGRRAGLSLSCNPDVTLELVPSARRRSRAFIAVGQVHPRLPFMGRDAFVEEDFFDLLLESPALDFELYAPPAQPVGLADHAIGLHASSLIRDGGTLQIGIGSLSDALVHWTLLRHEDNAAYRRSLRLAGIDHRYAGLIDACGGAAEFSTGLYGASEMVMDGFLHLYRRGVLKRRVYDWLPLQRLASQGLVGPRPTPALLEALFDCGAIASPLGAADVEQLRACGVFDDGVRHAGDSLIDRRGRALVNDLTDADRRSAVAAGCLGERLRLGTVLHGAFFLGTKRFYRQLAELDEAQRDEICMTGVERVNQLYGSEELDRLQRKEARFFNTIMKASLLGAATADALEDGRVVSGVGGQYNFVAMAHALDDGRSILLLRSTRGVGRRLESNIVWRYGHTTIPRHLRDIVVSEYGIADLRGRSDSECIAAMLEIADARFQPQLLVAARRAGKLRRDYRLPEHARGNLPERLDGLAASLPPELLERFPFGSDFSREEQALLTALQRIGQRARSWRGRLGLAWQSVTAGGIPSAATPCLERLALAQPRSLRERMYRRLVAAELQAAGQLR